VRRRGALAQRGQSLVEFALAVPVLLGLLGLTLQGGVLISDQIGLAHAANEGAQWAASNPGSATTGDNGTVATHVYQQLCGQGVAVGQTSATAPTRFCTTAAPTVHVTSRTTPTTMLMPPGSYRNAASDKKCQTWDLGASPTSIITTQGAQVQFSVSLTNIGGNNGDSEPQVTLSAGGIPPGVTPGVPSFNPATIAIGDASVLSFTTSTATPPGSYSISVNGTDQCQSGASSGTTTVDLTVTGSPVPAPTVSPNLPSIISTSVTSFVQAAGGITTLVGTNFQSGATVAIGSTPATLVTFVSSTQLLVTVPPGIPTGSYNITVTNPNGSSATLNNALTITLAAASPSPSASAGGGGGGVVVAACAPTAGGYEFVITISWAEPLFIPWVSRSFTLSASQYATCQ
jgi:Flp pilus assembly protein TadG